MPEAYREMGKTMGTDVCDAIDPILIEHRDTVLETYCAVPLEF